MQVISKDMALGVGINAPFGLETHWQTGTFPVFSGPVAAFEPARSRLKMFNFNPNLSYNVNDNLSLASGLDIYKVIDATLDTQGVKISGNGESIGWNTALMYVVDRWSFGLAFGSIRDIGYLPGIQISAVYDYSHHIHGSIL